MDRTTIEDTANSIATLGRAPSSARRRSPRIALPVPIEVSGKDVENSSFAISATAANLNRHGAMLHLNRDLSICSVLVLKNSRGSRTSARVVAQVGMVGDSYAYGVEFVEPENAQDFWGVNFPLRSRSN